MLPRLLRQLQPSTSRALCAQRPSHVPNTGIRRSAPGQQLVEYNQHRQIWIAWSVIITAGVGLFVWVKSDAESTRKEEMRRREELREQLEVDNRIRFFEEIAAKQGVSAPPSARAFVK